MDSIIAPRPQQRMLGAFSRQVLITARSSQVSEGIERMKWPSSQPFKPSCVHRRPLTKADDSQPNCKTSRTALGANIPNVVVVAEQTSEASSKIMNVNVA